MSRPVFQASCLTERQRQLAALGEYCARSLRVKLVLDVSVVDLYNRINVATRQIAGKQQW
jgi:hypothetical protein